MTKIRKPEDGGCFYCYIKDDELKYSNMLKSFVHDYCIKYNMRRMKKEDKIFFEKLLRELQKEGDDVQ